MKPTYKPLPYGSREYSALRKTEREETTRTKIGGQPCLIVRHEAAGPGLWTVDSAFIYEVLLRCGPIEGLSNNVTEVLAWGVSRAETIAEAQAVLAARKRGAR